MMVASALSIVPNASADAPTCVDTDNLPVGPVDPNVRVLICTSSSCPVSITVGPSTHPGFVPTTRTGACTYSDHMGDHFSIQHIDTAALSLTSFTTVTQDCVLVELYWRVGDERDSQPIDIGCSLGGGGT